MSPCLQILVGVWFLGVPVSSMAFYPDFATPMRVWLWPSLAWPVTLPVWAAWRLVAARTRGGRA